MRNLNTKEEMGCCALLRLELSAKLSKFQQTQSKKGKHIQKSSEARNSRHNISKIEKYIYIYIN